MRRLLKRLLPLVLVCGCSTHTTVTYRTAIRISPAQEAGLYDVEARVLRQTIRASSSPFHSHKTTHTEAVAAPKMMCKPNEAATATVTGENEELSVSAYIAKPTEGKESVCTLMVKQQGQIVSSAEFRSPPVNP